MNKGDLAVGLAQLRLTRLAESQGNSASESKLIAERTLRDGGLAKVKMLGTPEGSIITIVETHLNYVTKRCVDLGGREHFPQANREAISAIEAHRSRFGAGGLPSYPLDIDEYVFYRIGLEIRHEFGCSPEQLGFDKQTTKVLTHTAKAAITEMILSGGSSAGSKSCFVATACFGSSDHQVVFKLRRYREEVLRRSSLGRIAIFWYYKLSPPIASFLAKNDQARSVVRWLLRLVAGRI